MSEPVRCAVCGWPLEESRDKGCRPGDCCSRPLPIRAYDTERANREYAEFWGNQWSRRWEEPPEVAPSRSAAPKGGIGREDSGSPEERQQPSKLHNEGSSPSSPSTIKEFWPWRVVRGIEFDTFIELITDNSTPKECASGLRSVADWIVSDVEASAAPPSDSQILDWMIFHGATVICTRDGERCWVEWYPSDPEESKQTTHSTYQEKDARDALREAIRREEAHEYR